jgi:hypothetical protein
LGSTSDGVNWNVDAKVRSTTRPTLRERAVSPCGAFPQLPWRDIGAIEELDVLPGGVAEQQDHFDFRQQWISLEDSVRRSSGAARAMPPWSAGMGPLRFRVKNG